MTGSDALYISTDWEEFRGLAHTIQTTVKPPYLVIDGRRMIPDYETLYLIMATNIFLLAAHCCRQMKIWISRKMVRYPVKLNVI